MTLLAPALEENQHPEAHVGYRKDSNVDESRAAHVKGWLKKVTSAEEKWKVKFTEMRKNMEFVAGWQWDGQSKLDDERYINNIVLRLVNQKVASLYARDPQFLITRKDRMNYQVWDGKPESIVQAATEIQQAMSMFMQPDLNALAVLQDYEQGRERERTVDKICETLTKLLAYQVDSHRPEFKEQMKQLVRRVIICKVGYVKLRLCNVESNEQKANISTMAEESTEASRIQTAQTIYNDLEAGELSDDSGEVEHAKQLLLAVGASPVVDERPPGQYIEFDFPPATSIIPSEGTRSLKEFVASTFVAHKFKVTAGLVKAVFGVDLYQSGYCEDDVEAMVEKDTEDEKDERMVTIYEVFEYKTKSRFFIAEGFKDYVLAPEPVTPTISGFWPIFALTFNDVESEEDTKSSPFPPSDIDLLRNPQKEWNRTREALRDQRNANAPKYLTTEGTISEPDEQALKEAQPNSVTKLKGVAPGTDLKNIITVFQTAAIDPAVYDTSPLEKDILLAGGVQEANIGPAGKDVTATVGTIAEQSRMTMLASNTDDLDGFLNRIAKAATEMNVRGVSVDTARMLIGPGALLPDPMSADEYLMEIVAKVQAASSGRPNKAIDIANAQQILPMIMQAGGNPHGVIDELVKRLGDSIEMDKFFPLTPTALGIGNPAPAGSQATPPAAKSGSAQRTISPTGPPDQSGNVSKPVAQ